MKKYKIIKKQVQAHQIETALGLLPNSIEFTVQTMEINMIDGSDLVLTAQQRNAYKQLFLDKAKEFDEIEE